MDNKEEMTLLVMLKRGDGIVTDDEVNDCYYTIQIKKKARIKVFTLAADVKKAQELLVS